MWNGTRCPLALAAAALVFGCVSELEDGDTDTGDAPACGDYGYGETSCEDVADNIITCCTDDGLCDGSSQWALNNCDPEYNFHGVLENCQCDDCEEYGDEACTEFRNCMSACGWSWFED